MYLLAIELALFHYLSLERLDRFIACNFVEVRTKLGKCGFRGEGKVVRSVSNCDASLISPVSNALFDELQVIRSQRFARLSSSKQRVWRWCLYFVG